MPTRKAILVLLLSVFIPLVLAQSQDLGQFEKKVTELNLKNGLKFLIVERHEAPVVSFFTYADVGSVDDPKGQTGMAHLFEHMAFKGTTTIGTKDFAKESEAMKREDEAFEKLRRERQKGPLADAKRLQQFEREFEEAKNAAEQWVVSNEFGEAIDRAGGTGLNASTATDATRYFYSLPSNKIELWFTLESDRFLNPVLREFYTEKDVVMEERRMRVDSQPVGKLVEEFVAASFKAHPYQQPGVGHMSDLQNISRSEAYTFFKGYYGPSNLVIAIVGDVNPEQVKKLAQTYFERLPELPDPEPIGTKEPEQAGERTIIVEDKSQPFLVLGYHKGDIFHKDEATFAVLADILGRGRASRLYKKLVKEQKLAIEASGFPGFPGDKYPNLMVFFSVPAQGRTNEECETAVHAEIERLKTEAVSADELQKAKTRARADLIRGLASNTGIADQLTYYQAVTGDWRNLFRNLEKINAVTAADIQRVAKEYFVPKHETVGVIKTTS